MYSAARITREKASDALPPLVNGEHMGQAEFHRRYDAYPADVKIELIAGVVYVASPLQRVHARYHPILSGAVWLYSIATSGTELLDNVTTILGELSEPQPDLELRLLSTYGVQSLESVDDYVHGAPEWVAEIAHSTRAIDLHGKRDDYRRAGVGEYVVLCAEEQELFWYNFRSGRPIRPDRHGIARSRIFPGLWLHVPALLAGDSPRLIEVIQQGLAMPEHGRFVKRLEATRRRTRPG